MSDAEFIRIARDMGFVQSYGPDGFEGIQARFNYRLYLNGRTEDEPVCKPDAGDAAQGAHRN